MTKLREIGADSIIAAYQAYFGRDYAARITSETIEFFASDYFVNDQFLQTHWTVTCYIDTDWKIKISYNEHLFTDERTIERLRQFATAVQGYIDNYLKGRREDAQKQAVEAQEEPSSSDDADNA